MKSLFSKTRAKLPQAGELTELTRSDIGLAVEVGAIQREAHTAGQLPLGTSQDDMQA